MKTGKESKNSAETENTVPKMAVRAFMEHLIDYAGLFPPASLSLEAAIRNYAAYRADKDAWMLGRFIIPASRLDELDPYVPLFSNEMALNISVLGSKNDNAADCLKGLQADLAQITAFRERHGDAVEIGVLEMPLPPIPPMRELVKTIALETSKHSLNIFCEATVPVNTDWQRYGLATLDAIAAHNASGGEILGFKLRTGGVTADAFPTPKQVAAILLGCRDRGITMKFTAGLHHPIRMYRDEVNTWVHGFVNVFAAEMLAYANNLDIATVTEILADEAPAHFSFTAKSLAWREWTVSMSEITRLREAALCSYGSCSFDEPRDDLRSLQIL
ncbi:hypothetical protein [Aneurinibacillus tyrosinisolvens]|uniref:hypothetical protein n=1 Tax=Aneurinibacillus tyrosinisolvens TaxID=1443435 RepID=UPI000AE14802|nr:hypothetical protein [Aneurinibacillus tyrosinisolvens]